MTLDDYLKHTNTTGTQFAVLLGVPAPLVSQWRTGVRQVPAERCIAIEQITGGAVRCEDLRPDLPWGYLRATDCPGQRCTKEAA